MSGTNARTIGRAISQQGNSADILGGVKQSDRVKEARAKQADSDDQDTEARTGRGSGPSYQGATGTRNRTSAVNAANNRATDAAFTRGVANGRPTDPTVIPDKQFGGTVDPNALDQELAESGLNLGAPGSQQFPPFNPFGFGLGQLSPSSFGGGSGLGSSGGTGGSGSSGNADGKHKAESLAEKLAKYYEKHGEADTKKHFATELGVSEDQIGSLIDKLKNADQEDREGIIQEFIEDNDIDTAKARQALAQLGQNSNPLVDTTDIA